MPAERVRLAKLAGEQRYLARSRSVEPGSYYELRVSPMGHVRCSCPGFGYRGTCAHAAALRQRLGSQPEPDDVFARIKRNHA
jgi:uncharacterized Zn finger protein